MGSSIDRARSLAARTVFVKISPTPQNLTESRVVLQELEQKFGEVAMFRSLKYHPNSPVQNSALAIFQTESAARAALEKARHRYGLIIESQPVHAFVGPALPPVESEDASAGAEREEPQVKEFQLDIRHSDFVHEKYIKSPSTNPLYGAFRPVSPDYSFIAAALKQSLPPSPWAQGLMDWDTDAVKRKRGSGLEADLKGEDKVVGRQALLKRVHKKAVPRVMMGLKALKEERLRRIEEEKRQSIEEGSQADIGAPKMEVRKRGEGVATSRGDTG